MSRFYNIFITFLLIFLALAIVGGLSWTNTRFAQLHPGEKDFFVPWMAANTLLHYGNSPYSESAAQRAQVNYYGRLAATGQDPLRLSVPLPVEIFYLPFALVSDYAFARGLWMTCLEIAMVVMLILSLRLTGWKPPRTLLLVLLTFSILWIFGLLPLTNGSAVIFSTLAIVTLLLAVRDGRDEFAGAMLVVPFLQLDFSLLFVLFILWWAVYHHRGRIVAGFLMTLTILLAVSFFIIPDWFMPFIKGVVSHLSFQPGLSVGGIFTSWWTAIGPRLGLMLTALVLVVLFIEWRNVRQKDFRHFLWTSSFTLAITPLLGIPVILQAYSLLFFPLILFSSILAERWSRPFRWGLSGLIFILFIFGLWLITAALYLKGSFTALSDVLMLVFPSLLVLCLYWMRWWAVHPPRTWSDSLI
jgi:hypothetical protein